MIEKPKSLGSEAPQVLFVLGRAKSSEIQSNQCLNSSTGSYLIKLLNSVDLVGVSRFTNLIISSVSLMNTEYTWEHVDFIEEQTRWTELVKDEIIKYNPKLVVGLGQLVSDTLGVISSHNGVLTQVNINDKIYNYLPMYSPTWIMNNESNTVDQYLKELDSIRLYLGLESKLQSFNNLQKLDKCELMSAKTYDEFYDIYTRYLKSHELLAYDIETNAMPIYTKGSKIVGFSLACKENTVQWDKYEDTSKVGVYVVIESSDYIMSDDDKFKTFNLLKQILSSHRIVVHNSAYERPYTHHCLNYYLTYKQTEDTLVLARLMNGGKGKAGLKLQAQQFLGYPDWETDSYDFLSAFHNLTDIVTSSSKKKYKVYDSNGVEVSYMNSDISFVEYYELAKENYNYKGKKSKDFDNLHPVTYEVTRLIQILIKYYEEDEIPEVLNKLGDYIKKYPDPKSKSYESLPSRIVCKYGALDSIATIDLYNYYQARLTDETTNEVDLHEGYRNWKEHMYAGTVLECNGFHWNDEVATQDYKEFGEIKLRCLKYLVRSELSKDFIIDQCYNMYVARAISEIYTHEAGLLGIVIKDYDRKTNKYKLWLNDKRAAVGKLQDAVSKAPALVEQIKQSCYQYFMQELDDIQDESEIIKFYNPKSSTHSILPKTIFKNDDLLRFGHWMTRSLTLYTSPTMEDFRKSIQSGSHANAYEVKFFNLLELITDPLKLKELDIDINQVFEMMSELSSHIDNPEFRMQDEDYNIIIDTMSEPMIIDIASWYFHVGIDVEDDSTWTPEFRWLYTFREYKKVDKLVTSYIEGSVGRGSVYIVDKKVEESGAKDVPRLRPYDGKFDKETEDCILAASWGVNTADTGRWKSGMHTVPWNSPSKCYYDSRFKGGTIVAPDYSQAEVRTMAASANETAMLRAYEDGADIHAFTASRIWDKPIDQVEVAERRFAKMSTFSILYGSSEYSFAKNFCDGDLEKAHEIMSGFYEAYPNIKKWTEERHKEMDATGRVSLLSNRFIKISPKSQDRMEIEAAYRKAGNFPIQGSCFSKDVKLKMLDGTSKTIPEIIEQYDDEFYVYSYDQELDKIVPSKGCNARMTRITKEIVQITLDNNKFIECTPDHLFMLRSGEYCQARDLVEGSSLMPANFSISDKSKGDSLSGYELILQNNGDKDYTHRLVMPEVGQGCVRHHKNFNKLDNTPENLEEMTWTDHYRYHSQHSSEHLQYRWNHDDGSFKSAVREGIKKTHAIIWNDEEYVERKKLSFSKLSKELWSTPEYRDFMREVGNQWRSDPEKYTQWIKNVSEGVKSNSELMKKLSEGMTYKNKHKQELYPEWHENQKQSVREVCISRNSDTSMILKMKQGKILNYLNSLLNYADSRNITITDDNYEELREEYSGSKYRASYWNIIDKFGSLENALEQARYYNHKVKTIKIVEKEIPVYDIEVPKYHNFVLDAGIVVHNSSDIVGCVLFELCQYLDDNNYKSKPFMFVHDSLEVDIYPYELIDLLGKFNELLYTIPRERFGIPAKADFTLGKSLGHEIDLDGLDEVSEDKSRAIIKLSGYQDEVIDTIHAWKKAYKTVKVLEEEYKEEYIPLSDLFIPKKSYTKWLGKTRMKGSTKVLINYYESEDK